MDYDQLFTIEYLSDEGLSVPLEQLADIVRVWVEDTHIVTLSRRECRWVEGDPGAEIDNDTVLWRDVEAWLDHHPEEHPDAIDE
ncbi:hypothetical protein GCM10022247_34760 [Allokutzneria multivorans]|uniref:Uncharacterized protein n=1 Tax=Allokutzneria multivorans TaxID=1142134 RepID=A0ABP7SCD5_9PSEU